MEPRTPLLLREPPRSRALGLVVSLAAVGLTTALVYALRGVAPPVSLGVVYLLAVLLVSTYGVSGWACWPPCSALSHSTSSTSADGPPDDRSRRELGRAGRLPGRGGIRGRRAVLLCMESSGLHEHCVGDAAGLLPRARRERLPGDASGGPARGVEAGETWRNQEHDRWRNFVRATEALDPARRTTPS
jgi:hypothetical protein